MGGAVFHCLHMVEDRDRDDLRPTGDVSPHHQDDPELAYGVGETQCRRSQEAGSGQWNRNGEEPVDGRSAKSSRDFKLPVADPAKALCSG